MKRVESLQKYVGEEVDVWIPKLRMTSIDSSAILSAKPMNSVFPEYSQTCVVLSNDQVYDDHTSCSYKQPAMPIREIGHANTQRGLQPHIFQRKQRTILPQTPNVVSSFGYIDKHDTQKYKNA